MSGKLPSKIDPFKAADQGRVLRGIANTKQFKRLLKAVISIEEELSVEYSFQRDDLDRPYVEIDCKASMVLRCERCLGSMNLEFELKNHRLTLIDVSNESGEADVDGLLVDEKDLDLSELLEDEILLGLPLIPKHSALDECDQANVDWLIRQGETDSVESTNAHKPFAVLEMLKN
ncbi:YceD family protein [Acidihalobacter prosperus]